MKVHHTRASFVVSAVASVPSPSACVETVGHGQHTDVPASHPEGSLPAVQIPAPSFTRGSAAASAP